jgi:AcrR family transcriptional regulator
MTREIKELARQHLARDGAAALSLRAVARDLGVASSAIYRYYPKRDDLLTALIIDAYDAVGAAAEAGDASRPRQDLTGRWLAMCRATRRWALEHPHEYALIYGSPVPGYSAPQDTIGPASRLPMVLVRLLADAERSGQLSTPPDSLPVPPEVLADVRGTLEKLDRDQDVPADALIRGMIAWIQLFGAISFELFGQLNNTIEARDEFFDHNMTHMATFIGLPAAPPDAESA